MYWMRKASPTRAEGTGEVVIALDVGESRAPNSTFTTWSGAPLVILVAKVRTSTAICNVQRMVFP